jgi:uncharacterized paraquat-inducible protein A
MAAIAYLKTDCEQCDGSIEYPAELAGQSIECPHCQQTTTLAAFPAQPIVVAPPAIPSPQPRVVTGRRIKKSEFVGAGAAVQAVGCLAFLVGAVLCTSVLGMLFGVVGILIGLLLLIIGGRMAIKLVCSNCGNKLSGREVRICPVCHCHFER